MYYFISILILVVSVLLGLIVLVQNPKGGGLAANFAGSGSQFMGARQTADFLEKATWVLAGALLFLAVIGSATIPREQGGVEQSRVQEQIETAVDPTQVPNFPTTAPTTEPATTPPATTEEDNQ